MTGTELELTLLRYNMLSKKRAEAAYNTKLHEQAISFLA